jgi:hypothetical protein
MSFDGSDVGMSGDVDAFNLQPDGSLGGLQRVPHPVDRLRVKQTDCPCSRVQLASAWWESGAGAWNRTQASQLGSTIERGLPHLPWRSGIGRLSPFAPTPAALAFSARQRRESLQLPVDRDPATHDPRLAAQVGTVERQGAADGRSSTHKRRSPSVAAELESANAMMWW